MICMVVLIVPKEWACPLRCFTKNLLVCESYRHVGGTFGCFRKRPLAEVCWNLLILKLYSRNFVRMWKTTKPCLRVGSASLRQVKSGNVTAQTTRNYWGMGVWLPSSFNLGIGWRQTWPQGLRFTRKTLFTFLKNRPVCSNKSSMLSVQILRVRWPSSGGLLCALVQA
jgi:hypothetical protein